MKLVVIGNYRIWEKYIRIRIAEIIDVKKGNGRSEVKLVCIYILAPVSVEYKTG